MSIKSDKWIRRQCLPPTHVIVNADQIGRPYSPASQEELEAMKVKVSKENSFIIEAAPDCHVEWKPMIEPFVDGQIRHLEKRTTGYRKRVISYGLSSYGYDVQVDTKFKIFTNVNSAIVDPKNFDDKCYVEVDGAKDGYVIIPPNGFALANTLPYFRIPRDVLVICLGKSTYARCGIIVNVTPLEPEWEGQVVLEFSNTTNLPAKIYVREGVAQFLFLQSDEDCEVSYKDRGGKYMGQTGITLPKA